jgi:prepilin-type N-terminal cleavage/methylation domain-containing protein
MSRFIQKQGFTLIELMVVIVIIGVLASLAIPRFTEASAKAKVAEAPRVVASYESGFLARMAETGIGPETTEDLIFELPGSKWFSYSFNVGTNVSDYMFTAKASASMGKFDKDNELLSKYKFKSGTAGDCFAHSAKSSSTTIRKMIPNYFNDATTGAGYCAW